MQDETRSKIYRGEGDKTGEVWNPDHKYLEKPEKLFEADGRLYAFNLRNVQNIELDKLYSLLIDDESKEQEKLVEFGFLEGKGTLLKEIPRIKPKHQIGNGFEIFEDTKLMTAEEEADENITKNNSMALNKILM